MHFGAFYFIIEGNVLPSDFDNTMLLDTAVSIPKVPGKISRQTTKSGTYIHYVLERAYDPKKKFTASKRVLIGKLADNDSMYPNEKFFEYFPNVPMPAARDSALRCSTLMAGTYMVIRKIVQDYGLDKMLKEHFQERAGLVLDLASYMLVARRNQAQHFPSYAFRHPLFSEGMKIASDSAISRFLSTVTDDQITGFLNSWNGQRDHSPSIYVSYDSTNKNCQAGDIDLLEFGHSKVDIGTPIFNLGVAFDNTNRVPLFYELYPGSVNDCSQFKFLVDKALAYNYRRIGFILDRGYFSRANIEYLDKHRYQFIIMVKGCKPLVSELVDQMRGRFETKVESLLLEHRLGGVTIARKLYPEDQKNRYFHLFFNPTKMAKEQSRLQDSIVQMKKLLERWTGEKVTLQEPYTKYFDIYFNNKGELVSAKLKPGVLENELNRCGYFCIVTSKKMTAQEAYELYRGRDTSEKLFGADKTFLGSKSMRVHSSSALSTKILIEFIALIIRQRMFNLLKDEMLKLPVRNNSMTVPAAIEELEKIGLVRVNNGRYQLDHAVTKTQSVILRSFGITKADVEVMAGEIAGALAGEVTDSKAVSQDTAEDDDPDNDNLDDDFDDDILEEDDDEYAKEE